MVVIQLAHHLLSVTFFSSNACSLFSALEEFPGTNNTLHSFVGGSWYSFSSEFHITKKTPGEKLREQQE